MKKISLLLLVAGLAGCATTPPDAEFTKSIALSNIPCTLDTVEVTLSANDNIVLNDITKQRLQSQIEQVVKQKKKDRKCNTPEKREFILESKITQYEGGSAFARLMLIGLGQIHLDGDFKYNMKSTGENIGEFSVKKTFAWGGLYGGSTRIEDVEPAFAKGVAIALIPEEKTE